MHPDFQYEDYEEENNDEPNSPEPPKRNTTQIIWEKWVDPFGENTGETKWNQYDDDDDSEASMIYEEHIEKKIPKAVKVIQTPMGLVPYNEHTASSKIFNFWVGHTNFDITQDVLDVMEECPGVEILDPFTRYRFRIGVGKCFDETEVKYNIQQKTAELYGQQN